MTTDNKQQANSTHGLSAGLEASATFIRELLTVFDDVDSLTLSEAAGDDFDLTGDLAVF